MVANVVHPVAQTRTDAEDVVFISVDAFFDPLIAAQAHFESGKPGWAKRILLEEAMVPTWMTP